MQRFIEKPSTLLIPLIVAAAVLVAVGAGMAGFALSRTAANAEAVHMANIVRGGLQRAVKLELSGIPSQAIFAEVEGALSELEGLRDFSRSPSFVELSASIEAVRSSVAALRSAADESTRTRLLVVSEDAWRIGDRFRQDVASAADTQRSLYLWGLIATLLGVLLTMLAVFVSKYIVADKVEVEAAFDPMTGALRRDRFIERLSDFIASRPKGHSVGVVMLDLDRFKGINDSFGHDAGDTVLAAVGGALRSLLREGDAFGRLGGEEFAVAVKSKDSRAARLFAERARAAVESLRLERLPIITISAGSVILRQGEKAADALKRADSYLYAAKTAGRNRVRGD
jgi:diguanylate cyclase (GGDEF)-like protein